MDEKILEYAKNYVLHMIGYIENDLMTSFYNNETNNLLREKSKEWKRELKRIELLIEQNK